jgi:uncharacterized protein (DUF1015 family)
MPQFEPFGGWRYNPARVRLDQVIAPPYDVVDSAERQRLTSRHSVNSIRVELPEPDLRNRRPAREVAAQLLAAWREDGTLLVDPPSLYPYRMTTPAGRVTTGVIGALGVEEPGESTDVLPHEATLPKARSDRLELLQATRANLSPIWGLSRAAGLADLIDPEGRPVGDAVDDDGVRHQLWVDADPGRVSAIGAAVAGATLVIADGHHRYEVARAYREERRQATGEAGPADLVMALVTELAPEQLEVGAIHRTVSGLPASTDVAEAFARWFDVVRAGDADDRTIGALTRSGALALVTRRGAWMLLARAEAVDAAGSDLDSSLVALALADLPPHDLAFPTAVETAVGSVRSGEAQAALLLRPVRVDQIAEWADARRVMPAKTSFFVPKPRTGMVFRSLEPPPA